LTEVNSTDITTNKRKQGQLLKLFPFALAIIGIALIVVAILLINNSRNDRNGGSLTPEQQLMEYVRSKRVVPCHVNSINNFFFMYYNAWSQGDTTFLEGTFDNPKQARVSANVSEMVDYVSGIKVYITPGLRKNEVAAFVSYNMHFKNIKDLAPAMDSFYILMDTRDSQIKIMTKMYSDREVANLLALVSYKNPVRTLMNETQENLYEVLEKNNELRNLYYLMNSMSETVPAAADDESASSDDIKAETAADGTDETE